MSAETPEKTTTARSSSGTRPETPRRRGRRPGQKIEARPAIPNKEFEFIEEVEGKELADMRRKREERSDQQKYVDQLVYRLYEANEVNGMANGTIRNWPDLAVYVWRPSKASADTVQFYIKKACNFYGRRPVWGEIKEVAVEGDTEMHIEIPFSVVARREAIRSPDLSSDE